MIVSVVYNIIGAIYTCRNASLFLKFSLIGLKKKKKKIILCCADPPIKTSPIKYLLRLCLLHFKAYHYKVAGVCFTT